MRRKFWLIAVASLTLAIQGCTERVLSPPRIDLKQHEVVGVIEFACSGQGELAPFLTDRFVDAVRRDQGLVRIVLLGTEAKIRTPSRQSDRNIKSERSSPAMSSSPMSSPASQSDIV
jgi:hypothetical protein